VRPQVSAYNKVPFKEGQMVCAEELLPPTTPANSSWRYSRLLGKVPAGAGAQLDYVRVTLARFNTPLGQDPSGSGHPVKRRTKTRKFPR
jgi:hypothetical protein